MPCSAHVSQKTAITGGSATFVVVCAPAQIFAGFPHLHTAGIWETKVWEVVAIEIAGIGDAPAFFGGCGPESPHPEDKAIRTRARLR